MESLIGKILPSTVIVTRQPGKYQGGMVQLQLQPHTVRMVRHGQGVAIYSDGSKFEGQWHHDTPVEGTFTWPDHSQYFGHFYQNQRSGKGTLQLQSGLKIEGNWLQDQLYGKAVLTLSEDQLTEVRFERDVASVIERPRPRRELVTSDGSFFNHTLMVLSAVFGMSFLAIPKPAIAVLSGVFYLAQFIESLCSSTFGYLGNIVTPDHALAQLQEMVRCDPTVKIEIVNYHYEEVKIQYQKEDTLRKQFEEKEKELEEQQKRVDREIAEAKEQYFSQRKIILLQQEKSNLLQQQALLMEKYNFKEKTKKKEQPKTEVRKIQTHRETHQLTVQSCLDMSDNPVLEYPGLTRVHIELTIRYSEAAQAVKNEARQKIIAMNHTNRPHKERNNPRDVEHTVTEHVGMPCSTSSMLVCRERPSWAKRSYYILASLLGMSPMLRRRLSEESMVTEFRITKLIARLHD